MSKRREKRQQQKRAGAAWRYEQAAQAEDDLVTLTQLDGAMFGAMVRELGLDEAMRQACPICQAGGGEHG